MAGDYLHWQFQHTRKNVDLTFLAATDTQTNVISAKSANHRIYLQRIVVSVTTYAAVTWLFRDTAGTPVSFAFGSFPAAAVALGSETGTVTWDFGPNGTPLTKGKNLDIVLSAAGLAAIVHIDAYEKLEGPVAIASTN